MAVLAILLGVSVPMYTRTQRLQQLQTVAQGTSGAIVALRNLAFTGREVLGESASAYCLQVSSIAERTSMRLFAYTEQAGDPWFNPRGAGAATEDEAAQRFLGEDLIPIPDLRNDFRRVSLTGVWLLRGAEVVDAYAPGTADTLYAAPVLCFEPPRGNVRVISPDGALLTPERIAYEFGIPNEPLVLRMEIDRVTGKITASGRLQPPLTATP